MKIELNQNKVFLIMGQKKNPLARKGQMVKNILIKEHNKDFLIQLFLVRISQ